ncbi:MAG: hypothetical protein A2Z91_03395 [Deltaproteobacteria bacterium GWA2_38_16]|nr:MAG: hypothetical protein A2Z91_03395 [Deltaproteobacteria bacterium GWA2_38_16]OGQ02275.1 MAG: hypothetical protein A3D19_05570 [Deltaproteobacteria bacterium RIFCSPHIGHO2_02_FULL_38_15]OGQ33967.1 MAG: hypothetical protein A3A72_09115 [Deltaproteobacteria bacterium RIFCSPLOWO2_01_FULL_38_9]HBQ22041.1 6-phosphofructokinase [Deltaproteobacteria bacterium]
MNRIKKIGIMTGGGDCPGLNAAIRAVVRSAYNQHIEVLGFRFGWKGVIEKDYETLDLSVVSGILPRGGTFLGSSRTNPLGNKKWSSQIKENMAKLELDALIVTGGDGTLRATFELYEKEKLPLVAIPKTIDNDLMGTDQTFGFDTAVSIATEAIDRIHTTAESHQRVMIIEVMGRDTGWIATYAGIAGGADFILIPEVKITLKEIVEKLKERHKRGKTFSIIVVAEGANLDGIVKGEKGSITKFLAEKIEKETGYETRVTILGHVQRGGTPTPFDRILATRFGIYATQLVLGKKFGQMVALHGTDIVSVPLKEAVGKLKKCDLNLYDIAKTFFG